MHSMHQGRVVRKVSNEIDRLEIAVEAEANRANRALSGMEKRLDKIAQSLEKVISLSNGKFDFDNSFNTGNLKKADNAIDNISRKMRNLQGKTFSSKKNNSNDLKYAVKPLKEISRLFKDSTLDFDVDGKSIQQLKQMLGSFEREYDRLKHKLDDKIELDVATGGNGELGGKDVYRTIQQMEQYKNAVDRVTESLKKMRDASSVNSGEDKRADMPYFKKYNGDDINEYVYNKMKDIGRVTLKTEEPEKLASSYRKIGSEVDELMEKAKHAESAMEFEDAITEMARLKKIMQTIDWKLHPRNEKAESIVNPTAKKELFDYESRIRRVKKVLEELRQQGYKQGDEKFDKKAMALARLEVRLKKYKKEMKNAAEAEVGLRKSKNEAEELANKMKKVSNAARKATNSIWSGFKNAGNAIANATKKLIGFHKQNKKGMPLGRMLGSSVLFSFVFQGISAIQNAIAEGSNNLVQYSNQYNATISSMVSALTYLKNAWAAAFAPIVNVVGPYISSFVKMIATALNAVGTFFAALTGKGFVVHAKKVTQDYGASLAKVGGGAGKAAKGLGDANKKAKDLQKTIFGFDQMNILNGPKDSGSGGSGGSGGAGGGGGGLELSPSDMFETVPVEGAIADFAKNLRDAFLKEDWEGLGEIMAGAVNKGLQKLYDVISWDNVGPNITKFCNAFTTTFNSLVDNIDWDLMGRTIGTGFNTIVNTLYLLVDGIDWKNLGKKFGIGFMGLVDEVDWKKFGNLLGAKFMIAWELFVGFVRELDGEDIGEALADAFNGFFEEVDGEDIGEGVGRLIDVAIDTIKSFFKNAEWDKVGSEIWSGIKSAFQYASDEGENSGIIATVFGGFLTARTVSLITKIAGALKSLSEEFGKLKPLIPTGEGGFGKLLETLGGSVGKISIVAGAITLLGIGIKDLWDTSSSFRNNFTTMWNTIAKSVKDAKVKIWDNGLKPLGDDIKKLFQSLYRFYESSGIKKIFEAIVTFVGFIATSTIKLVIDGISSAVEVLSKALSKVVEFLTDVLDFFSDIGDKVSDFFGSIDKSSGLFSGIGDKISGLFNKKKIDVDINGNVKSVKDKVKKKDKKIDGFESKIKKTKFDKKAATGTVGNFTGMFTSKTEKGRWLKDAWGDFTAKFSKKSAARGLTSGTFGSYNAHYGTKSASRGLTSGNFGNFNAYYGSKSAKSGLTSGTFGSYNAYYGSKSARSGLTGGSWGNYNAYYGSKSSRSGLTNGNWGDFNAYYVTKSYKGNLLKTAWGDFTAYFTKKSAKKGLLSGLWGSFTALFSSGRKNADGGVFSAGRWKPVTAYANGGFPSASQLFIAREAGPELVGTIGGHTAVMNNDQIVSSVAAGVGSAVYRAMVAAGGNRGNEFHIHIGNREVTDYFIEEIRRRTMQTGNNPILV